MGDQSAAQFGNENKPELKIGPYLTRFCINLYCKRFFDVVYKFESE